MDAPGGAREPRFGSPYGMGLLGDVGDMYGGGRAGVRSAAPGPPRGLKRPAEWDERQPMPLEHCSLPDVADDAYAAMQPKKSPPSNGKKTKGRVKIKMEYIDNKLRRYTTFSKRKTGIMKKAYELSTLTGTQVMLLVASETGHVYTFATRKLQPMITSDSGKRLIQTCLNSPDPPTTSEQRMAATGYEETELTYNIVDEDMKVSGKERSSVETMEESLKRKAASCKVTEEDYICEPCYHLALQIINMELHKTDVYGEPAGPSTRGHTHVCIICGRSVLNQQRHHLSSKSTADALRVIEQQIAACYHTCHCCWMQASREVSEDLPDTDSSIMTPSSPVNQVVMPSIEDHRWNPNTGEQLQNVIEKNSLNVLNDPEPAIHDQIVNMANTVF